MRQKIVEAARKRFTHYGYGKTTMAEVASDCNMSTGNLYRYFPGKLDIAEEIGREASDQMVELMRQGAREGAPHAPNMLRSCLHKMLDMALNQFQDNAHVFEMMSFLRRERPDFLVWHSSRERQIIADILAAGNASGEFSIGDVNWTAELVRAASIKFHLPQLWVDTPRAELHRELDGVIDLLLPGLRVDYSAAASSRSLEHETDKPSGAAAGFL